MEGSRENLENKGLAGLRHDVVSGPQTGRGLADEKWVKNGHLFQTQPIKFPRNGPCSPFSSPGGMEGTVRT